MHYVHRNAARCGKNVHMYVYIYIYIYIYTVYQVDQLVTYRLAENWPVAGASVNTTLQFYIPIFLYDLLFPYPHPEWRVLDC